MRARINYFHKCISFETLWYLSGCNILKEQMQFSVRCSIDFFLCALLPKLVLLFPSPYSNGLKGLKRFRTKKKQKTKNLLNLPPGLWMTRLIFTKTAHWTALSVQWLNDKKGKRKKNNFIRVKLLHQNCTISPMTVLDPPGKPVTGTPSILGLFHFSSWGGDGMENFADPPPIYWLFINWRKFHPLPYSTKRNRRSTYITGSSDRSRTEWQKGRKEKITSQG